MFTVTITDVECFPEFGHKHAVYVRTFSHRSPKVAAERVWRQRGRYVGFQPPYAGTPVLQGREFKNGAKVTNQEWD